MVNSQTSTRRAACNFSVPRSNLAFSETHVHIVFPAPVIRYFHEGFIMMYHYWPVMRTFWYKAQPLRGIYALIGLLAIKAAIQLLRKDLEYSALLWFILVIWDESIA